MNTHPHEGNYGHTITFIGVNMRKRSMKYLCINKFHLNKLFKGTVFMWQKLFFVALHNKSPPPRLTYTTLRRAVATYQFISPLDLFFHILNGKSSDVVTVWVRCDQCRREKLKAQIGKLFRYYFYRRDQLNCDTFHISLWLPWKIVLN